MSITQGTITNVTAPESVGTGTQAQQLIVMINSLHNEVVYNELASFLFMVSLFTNETYDSLLNILQNKKFTIKTDGHVYMINEPAKIPIDHRPFEALVLNGDVQGSHMIIRATFKRH